jgi:hypothetical protein
MGLSVSFHSSGDGEEMEMEMEMEMDYSHHDNLLNQRDP